MEEMVEIPQSQLWNFCDQAVLAHTFQSALEFELIVLQWAFSKDYPRKIQPNKKNTGFTPPSLAGAVSHLKQDPRIPENLIKQIEAARKTRNDLVHNFAWKSLLLGPEQSRDHILYEAQKILKIAWFAVHDEWSRGSL